MYVVYRSWAEMLGALQDRETLIRVDQHIDETSINGYRNGLIGSVLVSWIEEPHVHIARLLVRRANLYTHAKEQENELLVDLLQARQIVEARLRLANSRLTLASGLFITGNGGIIRDMRELGARHNLWTYREGDSAIQVVV